MLLLLKTGACFAQNYFVFIGSDSKQPFYVRADSGFYSSSPEGHLILSELRDSTYNITIGFPGQPLPEQHYTFSIHGRDQAFQLRRQDADGQNARNVPSGQPELRLYDLQGKEWLEPKGGGMADDGIRAPGIKKDDAFSRMMAGVVHDTAVLYNTYAMEQALNDSSGAAPARSTAVPASTVAVSASPAMPTTPTAPATASTTAPAADTSSSTPATAIIHKPARAFNDTLSDDSSTEAVRVYRPTRSKDTTAAVTTSNTTVTAVGTAGSAPNYAMPPNAASPVPDTASSTSDAPSPASGSAGAPLYRPASKVTKLSERRSSHNVRLVYADHSGGRKTDTIVVIIPVDSPVTARIPARQQHAGDTPVNAKPRVRQHHGGDTTRVQVAHGPNADSPAMANSTTGRPMTPVIPPAESAKTHPADTQRRQPKAVPFINSDCHDFASDFDVDKLRLKMLQTSRDDDRVAIARKTFKIKCFSTRQIRTLSEVFTADAGRFHFFEAAWPFAADEHFHELSDLLTDPVYINRFKTMTHIQ